MAYQCRTPGLSAALGGVKSACAAILDERDHPDGVPFDFTPIIQANGGMRVERRLQAAVRSYNALLIATPELIVSGTANDA
ncbi:MAG: hypothetical protein WA459_06965 [Stellaceae bacterium]